MKGVFLSVLLALTASVAVFAQGRERESQVETAVEAVRNMGVGWNLGNTLDSNSGDTLNMWMEADKNRTVSSYETMWGQKVTRASLFRMFREAGFRAIRVPVTWYPHMEATFASVHRRDSGGCTPWLPSRDDIGTRIQKAWMQRVRQVVDDVLEQGLYCILNVHHDTGAANTAWLIADEENYALQHERFEALWTQIAEEFKHYDGRLLFEGYNEMLDVKRSWCYASFAADGRYDGAIARSAYNAINAYARSFVRAVRATGGNNVWRNLIVCTYGACDGGGTWSAHLQEPLTQMQLPADTLPGHLIFEVHCYPDISDPERAEDYVDATMANLQTHLVSKGAPVIFGEWGMSNRHAPADIRAAFVRYFAKSCRAHGMGLFHWMGLSDGNSRLVPRWDEPDLVRAMMEGYNE